MLVTPRPGVGRKHLLETLSVVKQDVGNLYGGGPRGYDQRLLAYLEWTTSAVEQLGSLISGADLDRLVLTRRYEQLFNGVGSLLGTGSERLTNFLVSLELKERVDAFNEAVRTLNQEIHRWSVSDYFLVADSSFYIQHPDKLELVDFAELISFWSGPIHLILPMVVVDELDGLKQSKDRHTRWRAGYTLSVLDRLLQGKDAVGRLRQADPEVQRTTGIRRGEVNVEILFDTPRHVRLPINDDEIVDRALTIKPLVGRQVTLLTYDTNQAHRGRQAELDVIKLSQELGEEPEELRPRTKS